VKGLNESHAMNKDLLKHIAVSTPAESIAVDATRLSAAAFINSTLNAETNCNQIMSIIDK
jgi:hypothetical protein